MTEEDRSAEDRQEPSNRGPTPETAGQRRDRSRRIALACWSVGLAAAGIGVGLLGQRLGNRILEGSLGPGLTLCGAGLWLFVRLRDRGGRS